MLFPCPECHGGVSTDARRCPHCDCRLPPPPGAAAATIYNAMKGAAWILGALALLCLLPGLAGDSSPDWIFGAVSFGLAATFVGGLARYRNWWD